MSELTLEQVQALATRKGYRVITMKKVRPEKMVYHLKEGKVLIAERDSLEQVVKLMDDLGALNRYFSH